MSDVLQVLHISWETFSKDMINLRSTVNFPSVGFFWLGALFVDCLACPCGVSALVLDACAHAFEHMSACESPLCSHLYDGLIGLAAKGPKASAA